ncbi:MAG: branched-chain amino acid ABC transporter permease [Pelagibacteraceae bacterium]|nr:branched-chain amino acid ABC transporter permease [Pelagibacteraceae bacterium]|tara:strand:- start:781 stop:1836 length:1056 start_codon:yes stop_codon:yes gene_type:complete
MKKNNLILYGVLLVLGLAAPFLFPAFKVQISFMLILIILAMTWDVQGGQMGYNSFGNILFFGIGMYLCASIQIGMFFPLAEWTESGGEKTFLHTPTQYFQGLAVGLVFAAIVPAIVAALIGYGILGLRGHYFAICTLGLGIAAGEIAGGIELIGAGQGMTTPPWPKGIGDTELRAEFFYYICFALLIATFSFLNWAYKKRFGLVLNAIRDNEDKAEAMGIHTMRYKIVGWVVSAFFVGLAGGLVGNIVGYIEPIEVAFDGREMGVFMVLMAILGGKGTLWGPVIGASAFHIFKEGFWTFFLGWQYVALGFLIVVIVVFFPEGFMGWLREKYPERFGEVIDEADRKAQVELK